MSRPHRNKSIIPGDGMMKCSIWLQQMHWFPGPGVSPPEEVCQDPVVGCHPRKEGLLEDKVKFCCKFAWKSKYKDIHVSPQMQM